MAISKELTQKLKRIDDSDYEDEDEEEENKDEILLQKEDNIKTESEIDDFITKYRRYWDDKHQKQTEKKEEKNVEISTEVVSTEKKDMKKDTNEVHRKAINVKKNNNGTLQENAINAKKSSDTLQENANDVESDKTYDITGATWHVQECTDKVQNKLCNKKKKKKSQNIDEMFDTMEEKLKHKVDLKLQKVKNRLKTNSNAKKPEEEKEEQKENEDDLTNLEFPNSKQKPVSDCPLEETISRETAQAEKDLTSLRTTANTEEESTSKSREAEIDPQKYIHVKPKYLKTQVPDVVTGEDENSEQEENMHKIMSEAFADDDVVEEFRKEQEEEVCNKNIKKIGKYGI